MGIYSRSKRRATAKRRKRLGKRPKEPAKKKRPAVGGQRPTRKKKRPAPKPKRPAPKPKARPVPKPKARPVPKKAPKSKVVRKKTLTRRQRQEVTKAAKRLDRVALAPRGKKGKAKVENWPFTPGTILIVPKEFDKGLPSWSGIAVLPLEELLKLREAADTSISASGLDAILYLLGISARELHEVE